MEFIVRPMTSRPSTLLVRYDCECGCKPAVRYDLETHEGGHEHCCCGNVHFVGERARAELEQYLAERKSTGEDADRGEYTLSEVVVTAPGGESVPVAYGIPQHHTHM